MYWLQGVLLLNLEEMYKHTLVISGPLLGCEFPLSWGSKSGSWGPESSQDILFAQTVALVVPNVDSHFFDSCLLRT